MDKLAVAEIFAWREPFGLGANLLMVAHSRDELLTETLAPRITQGGDRLKVLWGFWGEGGNGLTQGQEWVFGLSHQLHEDATLAATAAAKSAHDLCERRLEGLDLAV
jgi:hypothetical protein